MKSLLIHISFLVLLLPTTSVGQESVSLSDVIVETVNNHLNISAAEVDVDIAQQNADNQKWNRWPSIDLQFNPANSVSKNNTPQSLIRGAISNLTLNAVASLNWVVFEGYKQKYSQKRLDQEVDIQELNKYLQIEQRIQNTMEAYFKALIAKEEQIVFEETLMRTRNRYNNIEEQVRLGYQSNYDALRYKNRMLNDSINYVRSVNDYQNSIIELNRVVGNRTFQEYEVSDNMDLKFNPFREDRLLLDLLSDNHQLNLNSMRLEQKLTEADEIESQKFPRVSFNAGWSNGVNRTTFKEVDFPVDNGSNSQLNYGMTISQTLFNQRRIKNALENNELERLKMSVELDALEVELSNTVSKLVQEHNAKIQLLNLQDEILVTLKKNIDLEEDRYFNGLSSLLDFNNLQEEYTNALRTRLRSVYDILLLNSRILGVTGGLRKYYDYGG